MAGEPQARWLVKATNVHAQIFTAIHLPEQGRSALLTESTLGKIGGSVPGKRLIRLENDVALHDLTSNHKMPALAAALRAMASRKRTHRTINCKRDTTT